MLAPELRMVSPSWTAPMTQIPLPLTDLLSLKVLLVMMPAPEIPPPRLWPTVVMLPLIVQLEMVPPSRKMPPPSKTALLPVIVHDGIDDRHGSDVINTGPAVRDVARGNRIS